MSVCAWCGGPWDHSVALAPDAYLLLCLSCLPEVAAILAEPVQLPGRNDSCPECLENGITIKMKKCKEHNDDVYPISVEGDGPELAHCDERPIQEEARNDGATDGEGNKVDEIKELQ